MKIKNDKNKSLENLGVFKKREEIEKGGSSIKTSSSSKKVSSGFGEVFLDEKKKLDHTEIHRLIEEMVHLGSKLKDAPNVLSFYEYRSTIKNILSKIIPNTYEIEKSFSKPSMKKPISKEFYRIEKIDQSLESLLRMIQHQQKDNFQIASKIVEIKGLVVNLLN